MSSVSFLRPRDCVGCSEFFSQTRHRWGRGGVDMKQPGLRARDADPFEWARSKAIMLLLPRTHSSTADLPQASASCRGCVYGLRRMFTITVSCSSVRRRRAVRTDLSSAYYLLLYCTTAPSTALRAELPSIPRANTSSTARPAADTYFETVFGRSLSPSIQASLPAAMLHWAIVNGTELQSHVRYYCSLS